METASWKRVVGYKWAIVFVRLQWHIWRWLERKRIQKKRRKAEKLTEVSIMGWDDCWDQGKEEPPKELCWDSKRDSCICSENSHRMFGSRDVVKEEKGHDKQLLCFLRTITLGPDIWRKYLKKNKWFWEKREGGKGAERVESNKSLKVKFAKQSESRNRNNQELRRDENKVFRWIDTLRTESFRMEG